MDPSGHSLREFSFGGLIEETRAERNKGEPIINMGKPPLFTFEWVMMDDPNNRRDKNKWNKGESHYKRGYDSIIYYKGWAS